MGKKIFANKYVLRYQEHNTLPWWKRDGFPTYVDALKWEYFLENSDCHFKNIDVVNFDIIHNRRRGNPLENSKL